MRTTKQTLASKPKTPIYLDYAAATPMDPSVVSAMQPYFSDQFYNPSALYTSARQTKAVVEASRAKIAKILEVRASEIIFTAGSTEANNMVINGVMHQYTNTELAISQIEHDSVLHSASQYKVIKLPVSKDGLLDVKTATNLITNKTVLVSCMLVNNEIGTIQPVAELAKLLAQIKLARKQKGNMLPLYLHCDASQAFNYLSVLPHQLGVDFLVIGGSKIYGPKQTAILFIKTGVKLQPQILGGGQEFGLRAGTENVASSVGLCTAFEKASAIRKEESKRLTVLQNECIQQLQAKIPTIQINGSLKLRIPNNVHIMLHNVDNETLVMQLDELGIQVAAGSACSASNDQPSHVLKAIGLSDQAAQSSIRITFGRQTTKAQIEYFVSTLSHLLHS